MSPLDDINVSVIAKEKKCSINFSIANTKTLLSFALIVDDTYFFVNIKSPLISKLIIKTFSGKFISKP